MKISTKINGAAVNIILKVSPPIEGEEMKLSIIKLDWEGKEGLMKVDKDLENLMDYIEKSAFVLPDLTLKKVV